MIDGISLRTIGLFIASLVSASVASADLINTDLLTSNETPFAFVTSDQPVVSMSSIPLPSSPEEVRPSVQDTLTFAPSAAPRDTGPQSQAAVISICVVTQSSPQRRKPHGDQDTPDKPITALLTIPIEMRDLNC